MPSLTTPRTPTWLPTAFSRAARKSGQRRLVLAVELAPSGIESPSATTAPTWSFASTLTASRNHHEDVLVVKLAAAASPAWSPVAARVMYDVCLARLW